MYAKFYNFLYKETKNNKRTLRDIKKIYELHTFVLKCMNITKSQYRVETKRGKCRQRVQHVGEVH